MLNREEAAKFLICAWVKHWNMHMLLNHINQGFVPPNDEASMAELVERAPFMPPHFYWYFSNKGSGLPVRQYVSQAFPKLSAALLATTDNVKRLALAEQVMRLRAGDVRARSKFSSPDIYERAKAQRQARGQTLAYGLSRAAFKTHGRSAWNVCKA